MRALNVVAWGVLVLLGVAAVLAVNRVGPVGLMIVGLGTLLICTMMHLNGNAPTWGEHVFRARMEAGHEPGPDLRFYRWCGVALVAAGVAGVLFQMWRD